MIQKVGFKNFRRFKNFPEMNLGDINIFVGRNNAGKSTVLKALQLMKGNLNTLSSVSNRKNIFASMKPMFVFDVDELAELHIDNFERALYNKAERKEITLSATIDGCSFTIVLDGQNIEHDNYYVAVPYNFIELKDNSIHLTFDFQTRELHLELKTDYSEREKQTLMSKIMMRNVLKEQIEKLTATKRRLNEFIHGTSIQLDVQSDMIKILSERENVRKSLEASRKQLKMLEKVIDDLKDNKNGIAIGIKNLPEFIDAVQVNVVDQLFGNIKLYSFANFDLDLRKRENKNIVQNQRLIKESESELDAAKKRFLAALESFNLEYIHAHAASQKVIYLKEDKMDVLSRAISEFCKARIVPGDKEWIFIKKWMGLDKFGIGDDFRIDDIQSAGYMLKIIEDGKEMDLADKGTGSIQIMTLLFSLAVIMQKVEQDRYSYYPTILVEEPEQNIHPMLQSMLADMFFDFWQSISEYKKSQLIVETHSEYIIRRTQVLVANEEYESENELNEHNPFRVYYFEKDNLDEPYYPMTYGINGRFKESFGTGFYDAAGKLALDLSNHEKTEDNNSINWSVL